MLRIEDLRCGYGGLEAVHGISFEVEPGDTFALLGPNGAGKTSTIMAVAGHVQVFGGAIWFGDVDLFSVRTCDRVRHGVALAPEGRRLFPDLTVDENLEMGGYTRSRMDNHESKRRVFSLFPRLEERIGQYAGSLSGGEQQMLAIGRALMSQPGLLIIDELSLGLMPKVVDDIYAAIQSLKSEGMTILLVEQNTQRALEVADAACVLESGNVAWKGSTAEARQHPDLLEAYLGTARGQTPSDDREKVPDTF